MTREEYFEHLRKHVSELIEKSGLTQSQIAEKSGVKQSEISAFKNKGEGITSIYKINSILNALGYEVDISEKKTSFRNATFGRIIADKPRMIGGFGVGGKMEGKEVKESGKSGGRAKKEASRKKRLALPSNLTFRLTSQKGRAHRRSRPR